MTGDRLSGRSLGLRAWLAAGIAAAAIAGAGVAAVAAPAASSGDAAIAAALADIHKGDLKGARHAAANVLSHDPREARLQFLNALAYHLQAEHGDAAAMALAKVGYETSLRFDPNDFWAAYMLGALEFKQGDFGAAQNRFSTAVLIRPDSWRALTGLAVASYYAGDTGLASVAGARAAKLAPNEPDAQRAAALTAAASGDDGAARVYQTAYRKDGGRGDISARLDNLQRTAAIDAQTAGAPVQLAAGYDNGYGPAPSQSAGPPLPTPPMSQPADQVMVEVTLILADDSHTDLRGVNLLDGLQLQYGFQYSGVQVGGEPAESFQRTITHQIAVPQVTYSLNLLNNSQNYYWVLSRPTLTAHLNEESAFFVGHTVYVQVSGVNLANLQQVDAGIGVKFTPLAIDGQKVKFKIAADRSFFDPVSLQGFDKGISVFKEQASATAELEFGQTLILSGLSENVYDGDRSNVPGLHKAPLIGAFFGHSNIQQQQTSVLILVTPLPPVAIGLPRRLDRQSEAARVAELWTRMVDPLTDTGAVTDRLMRWRKFSRAEGGDLAVAGPSDKRLMGEALASLGGPKTGA